MLGKFIFDANFNFITFVFFENLFINFDRSSFF